MNRLAITVIYIFLSACASQPVQKTSSSAVKSSATDTLCPDKVGHAQVGVKPLMWAQDAENDVKNKYACEKNHSPYVVIERNELKPSEADKELVLQAGKEFTHCFIYTVCDSDLPSKSPIKATLTRTVLQKKTPKFQDISTGIELKAGRWTDVAKIKLPRYTERGDYIFQLNFSFQKTTIIRDLFFKLEKFKK